MFEKTFSRRPHNSSNGRRLQPAGRSMALRMAGLGAKLF